MKNQKNGAGRRAPGPSDRPVKAGKKGKKPKSGALPKLLLALVSFVNIVLNVVLYFLRRRDIVQAVGENEEVKLLLTRPKETIIGKKPESKEKT